MQPTVVRRPRARLASTGRLPTLEPLERRVLMARALGIDVSHWQGTINWTQVRAAGREFAFMKVSEGTSYVDPTAATNAANSRAAGVLAGVYHFAQPATNAAAAEAQHFLNAARNYVRAGYLKPVLDLETGGVATTAGRTALSNWVNTWCSTVRIATGVDPIIYCNTNYATNYFNSSVNVHDLWLANWNGQSPQTGDPPSGAWADWDFWQYSSTGSVPGIAGYVDLDAFRGTSAELQAFVIQPAEVRVQAGAVNVSDGQAAAVNFGSVVQGQAGPSVTFTVYNDGGENLTLGTPTLPAGFSVTEPLAATIAPGASDSFTVRLGTTTPAVRSGQITFTTNDPNENPFNFPVAGTVVPADTTAPVVTTAAFNYRTTPQRLTFTFSEDVGATLSLADLRVTAEPSGGAVTLTSYTYDPATRTATFVFPALADGNYKAVLPAGSVSDAAGNALAAEYTLHFWTLAGDVNRDRIVSSADFTALASSFGRSGMTYETGDLNGDGVVDSADFTLLARNFGKLVAPPPPAGG